MSTATLLAEKSAARETARSQQIAVLAEQRDPSRPLEGDLAHAFEEKDRHIAQFDVEIEALRKTMEHEASQRSAEFDGGEGRGASNAQPKATLGELMKSVDQHSRAQIVLGGIGAASAYQGNTRVNKGVWNSARFALNDDPDPELSDVMPPMTAMMRGERGVEMFQLDTTVAGITNTFPTTVWPLVTELFESTALLRVGRVITTPDENEISFPVRKKLAVLHNNDTDSYDGVTGMDDANTNANAFLEALAVGNGFAYVGEGTEIPVAKQTFDYVVLRGPKAGWITPITHEFTRRVSAFDVEMQLTADAMEMIDISVGTLLMNGQGGGTSHTTPQGLRTEVIKSANSDRQITGGQDDHEPTYEEMVKIEHAIVSGYAKSPSAAWLANWRTCGAIRRIVDNDGRPIYDTDPQGMFPARIGGKPVIPDESLPNVGDNVKGSIIFGDFSRYVTRIVEGIRLDYSFDVGFTSDRVFWRFLLNFDGRVAIPSAFSCFNSKDTA